MGLWQVFPQVSAMTSLTNAESGSTFTSAPARGVFLTFEGGDGVGKTTQIRFLAGVLERHGCEVLCLREPGGTSIGEQLRALVLDVHHAEMAPQTELLIYEAARAQIVAQVIAPALARGAVVLCDRFADSTVAYQGYGRGLDQDFISRANAFACQGVIPDKTFLLVLDTAEQGLQRAAHVQAADRLELAGEPFHTRVREGFTRLVQQHPERIVTIDAGGAPSAVARVIVARLQTLFPWLDAEAEQSGAYEALDQAVCEGFHE